MGSKKRAERVSRVKKSKIDEAAKKAAEEAIEELENEENDENEEYDLSEENDLQTIADSYDNVTNSLGYERDVFKEGNDFAMKHAIPVNFREYINGGLRKTIPGPYTWEEYRQDHPDENGIVRIVAVDANNKIRASQTMRIIALRKSLPNQEAPKQEHEDKGMGTLEMLEVMKENQREAEAKAASQQSNITSVMATIMQAMTQSQQNMMQMQQQSSQQFQTMLIEIQKQTQLQAQAAQTRAEDSNKNMFTLLSALLTKKPDDGGFTMATVLKMIQDAESRAENRATKNFELIEKKADALAETKAAAMGGDEGEESLTKTIIKGFVPVLAQMANNQQAQQQQALELEAKRSASLNAGFIDDKPKHMIPAARPNQANSPSRPQAPQQRNPNAVRPENPQAPRPVNQAPTATSGGETSVRRTLSGAQVQEKASEAQVIDQTRRIGKDTIFNFCAADIGQAMLVREEASKTAETVLAKLEKEGVSRQDMSNLFELEDFYGYADRLIPEEHRPEAKVWLKEFHEAIGQSAKTIRSQANGAAPIQSPKVVRKPNPPTGASGAETSAKRSLGVDAGVKRARVQSLEPS